MKTLTKTLLCVTAIIMSTLSVGCKDIHDASLMNQSRNSKHHIKQFSGGSLVGEWDSLGVVYCESNGINCAFQDARSGSVVRLTGDLQITVVADSPKR